MKTQGGFLISRIRNLSGRSFERILKESGVEAFNGAQGRILYVLWEHESLTISQISRLTSLANTTLTGMLDRMEAAGLVKRQADPNNRRHTIIRLTPEAQGLREAYERVSGEVDDIFYAGFTQAEIIQFEDMLRRIVRNYENLEESP